MFFRQKYRESVYYFVLIYFSIGFPSVSLASQCWKQTHFFFKWKISLFHAKMLICSLHASQIEQMIERLHMVAGVNVSHVPYSYVNL